MELRYGMIFMLSSLALCADESLNREEIVEKRFEEVAAAAKASSKKAPPTVAPVTTPPPCPCPDFSQRIQVGGNYSYAWIKPKGNHTTKGNMEGARAIYEYRPHDAIYAAVAFSWRFGTTKHGDTKRKLHDFNGQERIGYSFGKKRIGDNRLTFFSGVGTRYLAEKVSVHEASLKMDYTEFYVPVGFLFEHKVNSVFSWGCNFQWMPQVFPLVRLKPLTGAQWALEHKNNNYFVEVPFTLHSSRGRFEFIVSPFFETWHDGRSTAKTTEGLVLGLPSNSYRFAGVNVSFGLSF